MSKFVCEEMVKYRQCQCGDAEIAVLVFPSHESNSVSMYAGSNLDSAIGYAMI